MLGITNVSNAPSIVLTNTSVSTWTALPSTGTDSDMKTQGYTYYASIPCNGISANTIAEVTFSEADAKSGNYASTCRTYADEIRVYSKVNTAITIPSIIVHSIVETYYEIDNYPTDGSTNAVSSGGVYNALTNVQPMGVTSTSSGNGRIQRYGKLVVLKIYGMTVSSTGTFKSAGITAPKPIYYAEGSLTSSTGAFIGVAFLDTNSTSVLYHSVATGTAYGTIVYFTND